MSKIRFLSALLIALNFTIACSPAKTSTSATPAPGSSPTESKRIASTTVVKASTTGAVVSKGESAEALVKLNIDSGYHVNANPPTYSYLKATELTVPRTKEIAINFIVYPNAKTKKFAFADKPLAVYEGETTIKLSLKAEKTAASGSQNLSASLRVQACDEQVCYPPGELNLSIPVTIK